MFNRYILAALALAALLAGETVHANRLTDLCRKALVGTRTHSRAQFVAQYAHRIATTPLENERWMNLAADTFADGRILFLDIENATKKRLNDTMKDKAFVTALTNKFQELLIQELSLALADEGDIEPVLYSDFKAVRVALKLKRLARDQTALKQKLNAAFLRALNTYRDYITERKLIRAEDGDPTLWFRGGLGETADQASLAARYSRNLGTENWLSDFGDPIVRGQLEQRLAEVRISQKLLNDALAGTPLLQTAPFGRGLLTLTPKVFELFRKYPEHALLKAVIAKRHGFEPTDEQVSLIQTYAKQVDAFSPSIHVRSREIVTLDNSQHGGIAVDFVGQGGINLYETAQALSVSKDVARALHNTRLNEHSATLDFKERQRLVQITMQYVFSLHRVTGLFRVSGDDMVFRPDGPIPRAAIIQMAAELSKVTQPSSLRISYIVPNSRRGLSNDELVSHAEAMEKRTRAELEGRIPREKLDQLLLIIQKGGPEPELIVHAGAFLDMKEFFEVKSAFERARAEITSF